MPSPLEAAAAASTSASVSAGAGAGAGAARGRLVATLQTAQGLVDVSSYGGEAQIAAVMALVGRDLSEPYSVFTYRYFLDGWPEYCLLAHRREAVPRAAGGVGAAGELVGAILCKASPAKTGRMRGYVGMFAVDAAVRRCGIGSALAALSVQRMAADCDEVVLETEVTNAGALRLYESLGFVRDKLLAKYYLNGNAAYRLRAAFS